MSNVIAFPVNHPCNIAMLGEIDIALAQERMEGARDQLQDIFNWLIAFQDNLAKVTATSVPLSEAANFNLLAEQG